MPTYEYRCKDCGHEFEAVQSFTDDAISVCPSCGGAVKKRFGNVGISFKGSGFYKTDTRGSGTSGASSGSSSPSTGADGGGSSSGDSSSSASSGSGGDAGSSTSTTPASTGSSGSTTATSA